MSKLLTAADIQSSEGQQDIGLIKAAAVILEKILTIC